MKNEITQEEWADALIKAWNSRANLISALVIAFDVRTDESIQVDAWEKMIAATSLVRPTIAPKTFLPQPIAPWIAKHARRANDALWDGKIDAAKRLFSHGTNESTKTAVERELVKLKRERRKTAARTVFTKQRDRSKWHDWKTVK
jgi:hypothetical protein